MSGFPSPTIRYIRVIDSVWYLITSVGRLETKEKMLPQEIHDEVAKAKFLGVKLRVRVKAKTEVIE